MTIPHIIDEDEPIINGIDVDHIDERPTDLEHVGIKEISDGDLLALPFADPDDQPGYVQIDVDLMEYDDVCSHVQEQTDYERPINFARVPTWRPD